MEACAVVVIKEGVVDQCILVTGSTGMLVGHKAEAIFLKKCAEIISDWASKKQDEIDAILDDGYIEGMNYSICLTWPDKETA